MLAERDIATLATPTFSPVFLRNATAYGVSPRMRGDIVVNNLVAYAYATGEVRMQSDGTPWRPLAHVEDIARAFVAALEAPQEAIHNEAFNIGRDEDNHQIRDIARMVEQATGARVTLAPGAGPDTRSYRVDFAKSRRLFTPQWTVQKGIDEILAAYTGERPHARGLPLPALPAPPPPPGAGGGRRARRRAAPARARMSGRDTPLERMPVVILAGGLGTRLREETERVPKPLVGIGERPIVWHIMKLFGHHGAKRFVLCLGFKSWLIKEYFLRYREQIADLTVRLGDPGPPTFHTNGEEDWEVTLAETGLDTGTGGRIHRVRQYVDTDTFILTYGDGLGSVDIDALVDFHRSHGRIGTVTGVHPTSRYGEMKVADGVVTDFDEKPSTAEGYVSGGFFVFQREFFDYLDDDPELMFERAPLQQLARDGELAVFPHSGFWMGMDTFREFTELNRLWAAGDAPWKVWD